MSEIKNYPSNSHKAKAIAKKESDTKKQHKIVPVEGAVAKKATDGAGAKVLKWFGQDKDELRQYVIQDVIKPSIGQGILDILSMLFFGTSTRSGGNVRYTSGNTRVRYDRISTSGATTQTRRATRQASPIYSGYQDLVFQSRAMAEDVRMSLEDILDGFNQVTVADLYQSVKDEDGNTLPYNYNDFDYGWKNLAEVQIIARGDGYLLKMPAPQQL